MMRKTLGGGAWLIGLMLAATPAPASTISIGFVPSAQTVSDGEVVTVALGIAGLGDLAAPSLGAFDVDVAFDADVLTFTGVTYGDPVLGDQLDLFEQGSFTSTTPGAGIVNLFQLSFDEAEDLDDRQVMAFTLATLTFVGSPGVSFLTLSLKALGDAQGAELEASIGSATVTVEQSAVPVPEPGTLAFLTAGAMASAAALRLPT